MWIVWGNGLSMGDLTWLWENGRPVGICQNIWGNSSGVRPYGGAVKTYGKCHGIWEPAPAYGRPPGRMGSQKSHQNRNYWNGGRLVDFADFNKFLMGNAVLSGMPLKCMGIIKNMVMKDAPDVACRLCENQEPPACMGKPRYNMGTWTACGNVGYM